MSIELKKKVAVCKDICSIEEAETLLGWLIEQPSGKLNLKQLKHMHTAIVQVIIATKASVSVWPEDANVCRNIQWLLKADEA